jgi:ketosteroid isomerase-like protein
MRKADFAAAARSQAARPGPQVDATSEIQEIQVSGAWAFMWSRLTVVSKTWDGHDSNTRSGHTLTVFHRQEGRWLLARDANLLGPPSNAG